MAEDNNCGIYEIVCLVTQERYIGRSKNFKNRKWAHKSKLRAGKHPTKRLQKCWNEHGEENFEFRLIESCASDLKVLQSKEQMFLTGYGVEGKELLNSSKYADGGLHFCSDETKKLLSDLNTGKTHSPETRKKMSLSHSNDSEETRLLKSIASTGRRHTPESKAKISLANSNPSDETRARKAAAGRNISDATRALRSEKGKLIVISEETKAKMSASHAKHGPEVYAKVSAKLKGRKRTPETLKKIEEKKAFHALLFAEAGIPMDKKTKNKLLRRTFLKEYYAKQGIEYKQAEYKPKQKSK